MQKNEPKVAQHRPVYKRIAIGPEPAPRRPVVTVPAPSEALSVEAQRIWRHVVQTAGGEAVTPEPEAKAVDEVPDWTGGWFGAPVV